MPAKEVRKIIPTGNSVAVTIPKAYARYHDLKPGESVEIFYDDLLLVIPASSVEKFKERWEIIDRLLR